MQKAQNITNYQLLSSNHRKHVIILKNNDSYSFVSFNRYLLVASVFLFSSSASSVAKSDAFLIGFSIYAFALNIFDKNTQSFLVGVVKICLLFTIGLLTYYTKNLTLDLYTWVGFLIKILLAYSTAMYCKGNFDKYFVNIIFWLGLISLPLFVGQIINYNFLYSVNDLFGIKNTRGLDPNSNSLIFNIHPVHHLRNSGFMWEPGAFAAILIFALMISLRLENKINKRNIIFTLCILTTLSTMGYIALFIILAYFFYQKLNALSIILILPICIALFNINFITKKVQDQFNDIEDELILTQYSDEYNIHLNRFTSFYADMNTFLDNPLIGLGMDIYSTGKDEFYKEYDENVVRTSGLMMSLVKVGIIGTLLYLILLYRSIRDKYRDRKFAWFFCLIYLIVIFSNPIDFSTSVLSLLFL